MFALFKVTRTPADVVSEHQDGVISPSNLSLPPEIWHAVFRQGLPRLDLVNISLVCQTFCYEAESELYRNIDLAVRIASPGPWQRFADVVTKSPRRIHAVRSLALDFSVSYDEPPDDETGKDTLRLINGTLLRKLVNLKELHVRGQRTPYYDLPFKEGDASILFGGCTFQLHTFGSELLLANDLLDFFAGQPTIEVFFEERITWNTPLPIRQDIFPRLRVLRAGEVFLRILDPPNCLTHLSIHF